MSCMNFGIPWEIDSIDPITIDPITEPSRDIQVSAKMGPKSDAFQYKVGPLPAINYINEVISRVNMVITPVTQFIMAIYKGL